MKSRTLKLVENIEKFIVVHRLEAVFNEIIGKEEKFLYTYSETYSVNFLIWENLHHFVRDIKIWTYLYKDE